jgi:cell division protein FtsI (penicillin-binding protein 3)
MSVTAARLALPAGRVCLANQRSHSLLTARWRLIFLLLALLFVGAIVMLRIAWLGVVQPGPQQMTMAEALLPARGEITDRNGVPLARAFPARALWYNPDALGDGGTPLVKSVREVAERLAQIFPDLDAGMLEKRLASGHPGYIRRRVLPEDADKVQALGELALELPTERDRFYPQGSMAAHVLGYVAADGHGRVGMEDVLDERLLDPARRGEPSALSIDVRVQGALEDELRRGMLAVDAVGAAGIVLDVDTGEVLALASLPEFDPNAIDEEGQKLMFNRVTNQVYELGSTFKPLTIAAAIDAGAINNLSRRYSARPFRMGRFTIKDSHDLGASLNAPEALIHSSNVVTARIVDDIGPAQLKRVMEDLGMNERPYIELPARGFPIWASGSWPRLRAMTVGYGHGIAVTPLHLAGAYAAMVNGGIWRPATLHKLGPGEAPKGRRVFKASTSARMNQLLRMITLYGTGRNADAPGFRIGGKTGSAEKPGNGGYQRSSLVSTFAAAFPMDRPRYVVIAMLDEPKGTVRSSFQRTAAWNAAPVVGRVVPRIGPMLGVKPDSTRDIDLTDLKPLVRGGSE